MARRLLYWAAEACLLFGLWLLFVDQTGPHERLVAAGAAALAGDGTETVRGTEQPHFLPHFRWLISS